MTAAGKNYIGKTPSSTGKIFKGTGREIPGYAFTEATREEIDSAVQLADQAFAVTRKLNVEARTSFLERIAQGISESRTTLRDSGCAETGLGEQRLDGEITRTINQINLFVALLREGSWVNAIIDTAQPDRKPLPRADIRQMQQPLGVIGVFGASNFPFAFSTAGGDTIAAFAAGCPVVYKGHPGHPATTALTSRIILDAAAACKMPDGIFSLIQGELRETGQHLVMHPLIKAIAFTGSLAGGRAIFNAAASRPEPIPVFAEMGSINPVIILPEIMKAQHATLAKSLAASNCLSAGQFCTNPGAIVTLASQETDLFEAAFAEAIKGSTPEAMLTGGIHNAYTTGIQNFSSRAEVKLHAKALAEQPFLGAVPHAFQTSAAAFMATDALQEELFGPASLHITAGTTTELSQLIRSFHGQLTFSIWGTENDLRTFAEEIEELSTKGGRIICNGVPTGVEVTHAMMHGGPYPATTDSKFTSVGTQSIYRFTRPVCYQNFPSFLLPEALRDENPTSAWRKVNGTISNQPITSGI